VVTRVPQTTDAELHAAMESATVALTGWRATTLISKQQIMFSFIALV
jgi:malonate-semialdehyde dehydrogenase (acetylating) / methylmalonate-semialdehyde dehydrogenase